MAAAFRSQEPPAASMEPLTPLSEAPVVNTNLSFTDGLALAWSNRETILDALQAWKAFFNGDFFAVGGGMLGYMFKEPDPPELLPAKMPDSGPGPTLAMWPFKVRKYMETFPHHFSKKQWQLFRLSLRSAPT